MILILMGVSGVGKTTIGRLLAARTGWIFDDGDHHHSEANKRKMAAGIPLEDADRMPWLTLLHNRILKYHRENTNAILACSALKRKYRERLLDGFAESDFRLIELHAPMEVLRARLQERAHPFMNPLLLESQMATLEKPSDAWSISVVGEPGDAVDEILRRYDEKELPAASKGERQ